MAPAVELGSGKTSTRTSDRAFLDTNVLVYCIDVDDARKHRIARGIVERNDGPTYVLSTQVLQELYATVTRRLKRAFPAERADEAVQAFFDMPIVQIDKGIIRDAMPSSRRWQVSFWDALIIQSALHGGCKRLITEDLQDGRRFDGLVVENPFKEAR